MKKNDDSKDAPLLRPNKVSTGVFKKNLVSKWSKFGEDANLPNGWGDFYRKLINPLLI
jgi:hypothetical protein